MPQSTCRECQGTGWKPVKRNTSTRCGCRDRHIAAAMTALSRVPLADPDLRSFVEYLKEHCRGPRRAMKASELADVVLGRERRGGSDRRLRALAHAATEAGIPIASGNSGYFLATAPEHLDEVRRRLKNQALQHLARDKKLAALQDLLGRQRSGSVFDGADQEVDPNAE